MKKRGNCNYCNKQLKCLNVKYCNNQCQRDFEYYKYIKNWKDGKSDILTTGGNVSLYVKRYLLKKYQNKCSKCLWTGINPYTNKIVLEVEHIDGNYKNNIESNLTILCPNCHSLTATYRGANRGKGRRKRLISLTGKAPHL